MAFDVISMDPKYWYDKLVAELADLKEQLQLQHTNAQDFRDEILAVVAKYETK